MKKVASKFLILMVVLLLLAMSFMSCYGNFSLVKKLYKWNGTVGSKLANSAVAWLLIIIPVYEVAGLIDFVILNVIEYWSGENPVKMSAGERETQIVKKDGKEYQITATKNRFDVSELNSEGPQISLVYSEDLNAWFVESARERVKIAEFNENDQNNLVLIFPDQKTMSINLATHPYPLQ